MVRPGSVGTCSGYLDPDTRCVETVLDQIHGVCTAHAQCLSHDGAWGEYHPWKCPTCKLYLSVIDRNRSNASRPSIDKVLEAIAYLESLLVVIPEATNNPLKLGVEAFPFWLVQARLNVIRGKDYASLQEVIDERRVRAIPSGSASASVSGSVGASGSASACVSDLREKQCGVLSAMNLVGWIWVDGSTVQRITEDGVKDTKFHYKGSLRTSSLKNVRI